MHEEQHVRMTEEERLNQMRAILQFLDHQRPSPQLEIPKTTEPVAIEKDPLGR